MLKKLLTVVLPLMLPTLIYMAYMMIDRRKAAASGGAVVPWWVGAPWTWLITGGVLLAAIVLVTVALTGGFDTSGTYHPGPPDRRQGHRRGDSPPSGLAVGSAPVTPAGSIDLPPSMAAPETRRVFEAITADGAQARFVGGCVRDSLLRRAGQGYRHSDRCGAGASFTAAGSGKNTRNPDRDRPRHRHRRHHPGAFRDHDAAS